MKNRNSSPICPKWLGNPDDEANEKKREEIIDENCIVYYKMFPKVLSEIENKIICPCYCYSKKYLVKRLGEIWNYMINNELYNNNMDFTVLEGINK